MFKSDTLVSTANVTDLVGLSLLVQLRGETVGAPWQLPEASARRNLDKNVHPGKRLHERQGKGNAHSPETAAAVLAVV